ncbi:MAG: methyltransferase domain-containing protein [Vicinamibacteria bacterium]
MLQPPELERVAEVPLELRSLARGVQPYRHRRDDNAEIDGHQWYHTLELEPGRLTPGWFDLRDLVDTVLPSSLEGRRCLDVGTFDGFWAFEMERRGAASVTAIDLVDPRRWDWPANSEQNVVAALAARKRGGAGFELAKEAFGSSVERRELSIYDLEPAQLGEFDFVYVGSLLLHLRDPVGGLEAARSVCAGTLTLVDAIDLAQTRRHPRRAVATLDAVGRPWWWKPNLAGLAGFAEAAGFELIGLPKRLSIKPGPGHDRRLVSARLLLSRAGREHLRASWLGDPHGMVVARPSV